MVRIRFIVLLSLILLILPVHAQQEVNRATHTVQAGENLFRIALRYGVDLNTLAQSNSIADPATIYVGQVLSIPRCIRARFRRYYRKSVSGLFADYSCCRTWRISQINC